MQDIEKLEEVQLKETLRLFNTGLGGTQRLQAVNKEIRSLSLRGGAVVVLTHKSEAPILIPLINVSFLIPALPEAEPQLEPTLTPAESPKAKVRTKKTA